MQKIREIDSQNRWREHALRRLILNFENLIREEPIRVMLRVTVFCTIYIDTNIIHNIYVACYLFKI